MAYVSLCSALALLSPPPPLIALLPLCLTVILIACIPLMAYRLTLFMIDSYWVAHNAIYIVVFAFGALATAHTLLLSKRQDGPGYKFRMPARLALARWWLVGRSTQFIIGVAELVQFISIVIRPAPPVATTLGFQAVFFVSLLVCPILSSYALRSRLLDFIGNLGQRRDTKKERKRAAMIAAIVGSRDPKATLELAKRAFCVIRFSRLSEDDFVTNRDTGLFQKTEKVKLGDCDAFVSHSWSDDPVEKWSRLMEVAHEHKAQGGKDAVVWLDKACINQSNIDESLASLPVFLAGCSKLLVIAGPTYVTRLWCVMELFTFLQMGADVDRVDVRSIQTSDVMVRGLVNFTVEHSTCFKVEDRQKLLGIIETSWGSFNTFNQVRQRPTAPSIRQYRHSCYCYHGTYYF